MACWTTLGLCARETRCYNKCLYRGNQNLGLLLLSPEPHEGGPGHSHYSLRGQRGKHHLLPQQLQCNSGQHHHTKRATSCLRTAMAVPHEQSTVGESSTHNSLRRKSQALGRSRLSYASDRQGGTIEDRTSESFAHTLSVLEYLPASLLSYVIHPRWLCVVAD